MLSDGGDRLYEAVSPGEPPADLTQRLKLATASQAAACGDFDGDGRLDLASWNAKGLFLARRQEDGTLAIQTAGLSLPGCTGLAALDVGVPGRAGLLASTSAGPMLLLPSDQSNFTIRRLAGDRPGESVGSLGTGGFCVVADFNGDGVPDVAELFTKGLRLYWGEKPGRFLRPVQMDIALVSEPTAAVCGDFDADNLLDLVVGGTGGVVLLSQSADHAFTDNTSETGEIAYHGNLNRPTVTAIAACDLNDNARQSVTLFYRDRPPLPFFNRGFACFGVARDLLLETRPLKAATALPAGQATGVLVDLNGDDVDDLLAIDPQGHLQVLLAETPRELRPGLTLALPAGAAGPVTVTVMSADRVLGMHVVRAGAPVHIGQRAARPISLRWKDATGKTFVRDVDLIESKRVELSPAGEH